MDRLPSANLPPVQQEAARHPTFEETYPRYEFAELVRLTVAFAASLVKGRRRLETRRQRGVSRGPLSGGTPTPAE